jgi:2-C-methyl-D-erythritol 2,4-cyclodiphosphate synthase
VGDVRIGHGYDVHRFCEGSGITLGGVHIPHVAALKAHSDGDVLIHALCDAILGALSLGDIGRHFPDDDPANENIDSRILLKCVVALCKQRGYRVGNADLTVIAQAPKLAPHIDTMRAMLAGDLDVDVERINVKATTTEGLGFTGREEGIAAHAVVLLMSG